MEKLIELHDAVKLHPYRLHENRQLASYRKLLLALSHEFVVDVLKNNPKYEDCLGGFSHDFNGAILNLGRDDYKYINDTVAHVEKCLGVIHKYIDTQTILEYYTLYCGANILKSMDRNLTYKFDEVKSSYYLDIDKDQATRCVIEIEKHYNPFPPKVWHDWGIYSKYQYDYFKERANL